MTAMDLLDARKTAAEWLHAERCGCYAAWQTSRAMLDYPGIILYREACRELDAMADSLERSAAA